MFLYLKLIRLSQFFYFKLKNIKFCNKKYDIIVAARGALYNKASSPKESPG